VTDCPKASLYYTFLIEKVVYLRLGQIS